MLDQNPATRSFELPKTPDLYDQIKIDILDELRIYDELHQREETDPGSPRNCSTFSFQHST